MLWLTTNFQASYSDFAVLLDALAVLDALAGFAAATHPSQAAPGAHTWAGDASPVPGATCIVCFAWLIQLCLMLLRPELSGRIVHGSKDMALATVLALVGQFSAIEVIVASSLDEVTHDCATARTMVGSR